MAIRTIDHSDLWNDFRTNDPSDYRPVGLLTIRTGARFSDHWTFGPTTIRNIELSPTVGVAGDDIMFHILVALWDHSVFILYTSDWMSHSRDSILTLELPRGFFR